ncbi:hypothetical protein BLNAU_23870 [Blattamonas nauphoetae]|uniref:Uncharacterized protein n=1 Tax=Blattamonas nauphoetae TaxID=2049346 RepID=A0ABQ9WP05_9EUKA|nr:hypothetical protein BLNAU_23870 [Blattamonas nauphoetae]
MRSEEPNFTSLIEKMDEDDMWKKVEDSEDSSDDDSTGDDSDSEEENDHTIVHLLPTTPQLLNSLSPFELLLRAIACFTVSIEAAVMIKDYPTIVAVSSELLCKTHPAIVRSLILILEALKTIPVPNEETGDIGQPVGVDVVSILRLALPPAAKKGKKGKKAAASEEEPKKTPKERKRPLNQKRHNLPTTI